MEPRAAGETPSRHTPNRSPKTMPENQTLSKPTSAEEPRDEGLSSGDLLARYRAVCEELEAYRIRRFPRRSFVHVEGVGVGVVVATDGCPPHKIPVLVESGNVWFYELDRCEPTTAKHAGYSLREIWLTRNGYKPLPMSRFRFRNRAN
ncbi:MAG: hypothetical protein RL088_3444, partial [Verrucomicrobiota bacterium]